MESNEMKRKTSSSTINHSVWADLKSRLFQSTRPFSWSRHTLLYPSFKTFLYWKKQFRCLT